MSGDGITQLIFFIAAIVIAVGVIGVVTVNVQSISASYGMNSKTLADQLKTDITIINDPGAIPNSSSNYSFYVKNTGKSTLDPTTVNMFVDGKYTMNLTYKIMENTTLWYPTNVLMLNYTYGVNKNPVLSSSPDHTVRVVAGNGVFDTMAFRI
ncbi:MAG: flagellar protein G [Candidatus Methanoperedens sp.]|nr:flagellar protein G [Candidatus Methanoperedens sp.]